MHPLWSHNRLFSITYKITALSLLCTLSLTACIFGSSSEQHLTQAERWMLLPSVVTLEKPIHTFHGYKVQKGAALPDTAQLIRGAIQRSTEKAPGSGIDLLGPGFYVGAEPDSNSGFYQSRPSLDNQGVLLQVPLRQGARLLMLESDLDSENSRSPGISNTLKQWMREPEYLEKKKALISDLKLDGIVYAWGGTFYHPLCPDALPGATNSKNWAFILLNPEAIDWKNVVTVSENRSADPSQSDSKTESVRQAAYRFLHDRYERRGNDYPIGIQPATDPLWSTDQFNQYIHENVFGCRDRVTERDSIESWANQKEHQIRSRWKSAVIEGQTQGISIHQLARVIAPRFINTPDWEKALAAGIPHPNKIYEPAPTTWNQWQKVSEENISKFEQNPRSTVSLSDVQDWNRTALWNTLPDSNTGGILKTSNNYGKNVKKAKAIGFSEVRAIQEKGLSWMPLKCSEDVPETLDLERSPNKDCRKIYEYADDHQDSAGFWAKTYQQMKQGLYQNEWYWFACWPKDKDIGFAQLDQPDAKQCGAVVYSEPKNIQPQLENILGELNSLSHEPNSLWSQVLTGLLMQQKTVALHPFDKGNGRVSRWMMDIATSRAELPPIHFKDMDQDLSTPLRTLVIESVARMEKLVEGVEKCLTDPSEKQSLQCQVIR